MPRYRFNFRDAEALIVDEIGTEFENLDLAYLDAFRAAQDIWHERLKARRDPRSCAFEIADDDGNLLMVLPFLEVLESCQSNSCRGDRAAPSRHRTAFADALANTHRMQRLTRELSRQIRTNQTAIRRARALVERSRRTSTGPG
jgi:hypothetical protein